MALDQDAQELYDLAKATLPRMLFDAGVGLQEPLEGAAAVFGRVRQEIRAWFDRLYITRSFGAPLDAHARQNGTRRQVGENDATLQGRLRNPADAVTAPALLSAINVALANGGLTEEAALVNLRREGGYFGRGVFGAHRMGHGGTPNEIIVVLPYNTPAGTVAAITEIVRGGKAAGTIARIEVRTSP